MSALIELDSAGEERYDRMIQAIDLASRPFTSADLEQANAYHRAQPPRARSASARPTAMPSGREEPDMNLLRPVVLSVLQPAPGAAKRRALSPPWSLVGSGTDPEAEPDADASSLPQGAHTK